MSELPVIDPAPSSQCWPVDWGGAEPTDASVRGRAEELAVATLRVLTANRVGGCPVTVRPCHRHRPSQPTWEQAIVDKGVTLGPYLAAVCAADRVTEVTLPGVVGEVYQVTVDGVVVDPSAYRVDDARILVRQDGGTWPACQEMSLPSGAEGTFEVTFRPGFRPDALAAYIAGVLAQEFVRALGVGACKLPAGVTQVVRQGVSVTIATGLFRSARSTGIPVVDQWIASVNPYGSRSDAVIVTPESPRVRATTWVAPA